MDNKQISSITKKMIVSGIVQGVGFRPLVYRLAKKYKVYGTVRNMGGQVEIITRSTRGALQDFLQELRENKENVYEIVNIDMKDLPATEFCDFSIIESDVSEEGAMLSPDLPICTNCKEELYTTRDRRFRNPFISCMACGPRYTIMEELPYDRHKTTMKEFVMCPSCKNEYTSPKSRRFHAQTISCHDCGPYLFFNQYTTEGTRKYSSNRESFDQAVAILKTGGVLAVKGVGGYHFTCSPFVEATVARLRKLKGREEKPFAVMFGSIDSVREYCQVSKEEQILLESKARPIVLLSATDKKMAASTNKGSLNCGAFLPYTALQMMLTKECGPLVMTSANVSNKPIIKDEQEMLSIRSPYLQGVLYNARRIVRSVDDSVAKVMDEKPQVIRRSRGLVPYPIFLSDVQVENKSLQIFAAGGDLKAAFCLYKKGNAVVSQYFGDLEERTILNEYQHEVEDLKGLLNITPDIAICDLHPNYFSSKYVKTLGVPILMVQHHHAHIASVMAEHNIKEKVIGIAFDGTGYGTDGNVWGSEFLVCEGAGYSRVAHMSYTPMIGGDQSMRDAKKTALCYLLHFGLEACVKDDRSKIIKAAIVNRVNTILSSSMGRLFDAVAAILGIRDENSYEGECAISLEKEAILAMKKGILPQKLSFAIKQEDGVLILDPKPLLEAICKYRDSVAIGSLALGFHYAVADSMVQVCELIKEEQKTSLVALSGGVFQNTLLTEYVMKRLREREFRVYVNKEVPPNDGSLSLGQTYIGLMRGENGCV